MPKRKGSLTAILASFPRDGGGPIAHPYFAEDDPGWSPGINRRTGGRPPQRPDTVTPRPRSRQIPNATERDYARPLRPSYQSRRWRRT